MNNREEWINLDEFGLSDEELFAQMPMDETGIERITAPRYSYWHSVFRVFFRKKTNIVVLGALVVLFVFAYIYPSIHGYDQYVNIMDSTTYHLKPSAAIERFGFNISWVFGTGESGQSTFDAIWYGARISVTLSIICAAINLSIGVVVGAVWGFSKRLDLVMTEVRNIIGNVPNTLIISVMVLVFSPSFWTLIFAMCITGWMGVAGQLRTQVIIIRDRDYNLASKCLGTSTFRIAIRNILPHMTSIIVTMAATEIPGYISMETFLSYIGLGISDTTLGKIIFNAQSAMVTPGWGWEFWPPVLLAAFISIVLFVVGQNIGDAADPRTHVL
ncbi:MAG: ABC transporter permease [Lachnospiraceae bacterium]|nr:ABC transporter permease [Lachnospiraceae bacterium]